MRSYCLGCGVAVILAASLTAGVGPSRPAHYIYFGIERDRIRESSFLDEPAIAGAQLKYTWPELEPERDRYDLAPLLADLAWLKQHGKRLFVQVQDVSFSDTIVNVPAYLLRDSTFHGGVARQYERTDDGRLVAEGWVARRWAPSVRARFVRLITALADSLDGRIEGVNFPETAIGMGPADLWPPGYTPDTYAAGIRDIMTAAGAAFRRSVVIQYANFMPGEELPGHDRGYLRGIYAHAARVGVGVGGPDLLPLRWFQRHNSYPLIAAREKAVVAGLAVQWGNLDDHDRRTGLQVTVDHLYAYAADTLHLDYIFWGTQEPYYSRDIMPFLHGLGKR